MLVLMTAAFVIMVLAVTNAWDPRPYLQNWWDNITALSDPDPPWVARAGGQPDAAALMAGGQVVVATRGFVDAYHRADGDVIWHKEVQWAYPAADVVVARLRPENPDADKQPDVGYSVIDPSTGGVLWGELEAIAVWPFADTIVDLVCPGAGDCQLRARKHLDGGRTVWTVTVPAAARVIRGANPALVGTRDPAGWFDAAAIGTPGRMPQVIGLNVDQRIQLIDTFAGVKVREVAVPDRLTRVGLSGDRLLFVHAERAESGCRTRVEAVDYRTGAPAWQRDGFDLGTASGAGCEQRKDPLGADRYLVGIDGESKPVVLGVDQAEERWVGVAGERILATRGGFVVVVGADRTTVRIIDMLSAGKVALWTGKLGLDPQAAITQDHVILRDPDAGRLLAFSLTGMVPRLTIKTKADVIGYGREGVVIASGRRFGLHPLRR
jgi:outer membrane protein assembly factor BamB